MAVTPRSPWLKTEGRMLFYKCRQSPYGASGRDVPTRVAVGSGFAASRWDLQQKSTRIGAAGIPGACLPSIAMCLAAVSLSEVKQSVFWKHPRFGSWVRPSLSSALLQTQGWVVGARGVPHPWGARGGCSDQPKPRFPSTRASRRAGGREEGESEGNSSHASGLR